MTSMIDVLVVLTVFLLITFEASPECHATNRKLPVAPNAYLDVVHAPLVDVHVDATFLDGIRVSSPSDLVTRLKARRDLMKQLVPGGNVPGNVIFAIDPDVNSGVVKAMVKAAADGGYPSIDFMVHPG